jgi:SPP1 family predicted phage head-tail adaptor
MGLVPLMPLNAGQLWTRVTIQKSTPTKNEVGEAVLSWADYQTVWADVQALGGREAQRYAETIGISTHKVTIRYVQGLTTAYRVIYDGRTLEIGQINELERRWYMELICTERAAS